MRPEVREAFEAAVDSGDSNFSGVRRKSERAVRQEAMLLAKRFEQVIECMNEDLQSMTLRELYEEIAGQAWRGTE